MLRYDHDNLSFYGVYNGFRAYLPDANPTDTIEWTKAENTFFDKLGEKVIGRGIDMGDWDFLILPDLKKAAQDVRGDEGIFEAVRARGTQMTNAEGQPVASWLIDDDVAFEILLPVAQRLTEEYRAKRIAKLEKAITELDGKDLPSDAEVRCYERDYARQNGFYLNLPTQERLANGKTELAELKGE